MSRPASRLHLEFDPLTKVCRCGCGLFDFLRLSIWMIRSVTSTARMVLR